MKKRRGNPQQFFKHPEEMAETPLSVRVPVDIDRYVRSQPNRTEWLRQAIAAQIEADKQKMSTQQGGAAAPGSELAV